MGELDELRSRIVVLEQMLLQNYIDPRTGKQHYLRNLWKHMRGRCRNNPDYAGRGIRVHGAWDKDYESFRTWIQANLGERPEGYSLDRIDNDGHYEPGNVRWADDLTQTQNRRPYVRRVRTFEESHAGHEISNTNRSCLTCERKKDANRSDAAKEAKRIRERNRRATSIEGDSLS